MPEGDAPELSVVLACRNGEPYLAEQLDSLLAQEDPPSWELIFVDNGSTDRSVEIATSYRDRLPLTIVPAPDEPNVSYARNVGAARARADRLVFIDADDRLEPGFLRAMADALHTHAVVAGQQVPDHSSSTPAVASTTGSPPPQWAPRPSDEFLPYAQGNAIGIQRRWFDRVGGFDLEMGRSMCEDVDLSWAVQLAGGDLHVAGGARVRYRSRPDLASVRRQQFRVGRGQALLYRRYRHVGMPSAGAAEVTSRWGAILLAVPAVPVSATIRGRWMGVASRRAGRVVGSLQQRVLYL